jgi:hypothetical protein
MKNLMLSFVILFMAANALASKTPKHPLSQMEIIANGLKRYIYTLTEPALIFHYFNADNAVPEWRGPLSSSDPKGYAYTLKSSQIYWKNFGLNDDHNNVYGRGLYFAEDPVATNGFGGFNFVLLQLRLPIGFRVLDLSNYHDVFSDDEQQALKQQGCENIVGPESLMQPGTTKSPICLQNLIQVLRDQLQIDGISYNYQRSFFSECPSPPNYKNYTLETQSAFILTDIKSIRPEMVRIFNRWTQDDREERIHIQSLFYKNVHDSTLDIKNITIIMQFNNMEKILGKLYPGYKISSFNFVCSRAECITLEICENKDTKHCLTIHLPNVEPQPYPDLFDSFHPPLTLTTEAQGQVWMWPDLNHQPTDPAPGEWIKKNLLGCGKTHFIPAYPKGSR